MLQQCEDSAWIRVQARDANSGGLVAPDHVMWHEGWLQAWASWVPHPIHAAAVIWVVEHHHVCPHLPMQVCMLLAAHTYRLQAKGIGSLVATCMQVTVPWESVAFAICAPTQLSRHLYVQVSKS